MEESLKLGCAANVPSAAEPANNSSAAVSVIACRRHCANVRMNVIYYRRAEHCFCADVDAAHRLTAAMDGLGASSCLDDDDFQVNLLRLGDAACYYVIKRLADKIRSTSMKIYEFL